MARSTESPVKTESLRQYAAMTTRASAIIQANAAYRWSASILCIADVG